MSIIFSSALKKLFKQNKEENQPPAPDVQKTNQKTSRDAENRSAEQMKGAHEDGEKDKLPEEK